MDSKNLWIAYSDIEDLDADMKDAVEDKLLYTEVCIKDVYKRQVNSHTSAERIRIRNLMTHDKNSVFRHDKLS